MVAQAAHLQNHYSKRYTSIDMSNEQQTIVIKKYANRRLYNTGTSTYVTLEDLASMVKKGENFEVFDAKSGEEITRSVLAQIIFEQESKVGQKLLPASFLRQLIGYYGDSMESLVPRFLELSMGRFAGEQEAFRGQLAKTFGAKAFSAQAFGAMDDLARQNMAMFSHAMSVLNPFVALQGQRRQEAQADSEGAATAAQDLDSLKAQMDEIQKKLEAISKKK